MDKFLQIDEEGYFMHNGLRVQDADYAADLFEHLKKDESAKFVTRSDGQEVIVEAFDEPLIARQIYHSGPGKWEIEMPYGWRQSFDLHTFSLDEWDRFHGETTGGLPFVLSRFAQAEFFNLCDSFTDDSVTVDNEQIQIPAWLRAHAEPSSHQFWNQVYVTEPTPGFDLQKPAPALVDVLNKIKIPKSRILVLGAGPCHDAVYLAQQGHLVTAVDFSHEGVEKARAQYGSTPNLQIVEADIFKLPASFNRSFDIVFEHTCYCAVDPERRNELVMVWRRCLVETGHLLGIFFAMDKRQGPPFGGSEWEVRQRLKKSFQFLYWQRLHNSVPRRLGKEFVVYAQKKSE